MKVSLLNWVNRTIDSIELTNSSADELNIKSRLVPLNRRASGDLLSGESEHSVMLPLEIEEGKENKENAYDCLFDIIVWFCGGVGISLESYWNSLSPGVFFNFSQ